jgi:hypothetical protein
MDAPKIKKKEKKKKRRGITSLLVKLFIVTKILTTEWLIRWLTCEKRWNSDFNTVGFIFSPSIDLLLLLLLSERNRNMMVCNTMLSTLLFSKVSPSAFTWCFFFPIALNWWFFFLQSVSGYQTTYISVITVMEMGSLLV